MIHISMAVVLLLNSLYSFANNKVRHVPVTKDEIVTVKTSLGIATIIEVPDRPNSVVVGDQDAFKVEYLDQAITIKPLSPGAKSNLYVYTDSARFNVELITGPEPVADYVVYLEHQKKIQKTVTNTKKDIVWTKLTNYLRNENIRMDVSQVGRTGHGILLVEFVLSSSKLDAVKPEWFWVTQDTKTIPIQNLFLSNVELGLSKPVKGTIQILAKDLNLDVPFRLELRRAKNSFLTLKKVGLWK